MEKVKNSECCWTVYKHTSPSGKVYIGITSQDAERRWRKNGEGYLRKYKNGGYIHPAFANAILKYGWDNIKHEILYKNLDKEEAVILEQQLIFENKDNTYNLTAGGDGCHKRVVSQETREKMSKAQKGHPGYRKGIPLTEEHKKKISKAIKGRTLTEEHKRKVSEARKGMKFTEEHIENMRKVRLGHIPWNKGIKYPEELCKKFAISQIGRKQTEESKKKIGDAQAISVEIDGIKYRSYKEAGKALGVSQNTISRRVKNPNFPNYIKLNN